MGLIDLLLISLVIGGRLIALVISGCWPDLLGGMLINLLIALLIVGSLPDLLVGERLVDLLLGVALLIGCRLIDLLLIPIPIPILIPILIHSRLIPMIRRISPDLLVICFAVEGLQRVFIPQHAVGFLFFGLMFLNPGGLGG